MMANRLGRAPVCCACDSRKASRHWSKGGLYFCSELCRDGNRGHAKYSRPSMPPLVPFYRNVAWEVNAVENVDYDYDFFEEWTSGKVSESEFLSKYQVPGHACPVTIKGFRSTSIAFIEIKSTEIEEHLAEIAREIDEYVRRGSLELYRPQSKQKYGLSYYAGQWRRLLILQVKEKQEGYAVVKLMDTGEIRKCALAFLFYLPEKIAARQSSVVDIKLKDVADLPLTSIKSNQTEFLKSSIGTVCRIMFKHDATGAERLEKAILLVAEERLLLVLNDKLSEMFEPKIEGIEDYETDLSDGDFTVVSTETLRESGAIACVRQEDHEWFNLMQESLLRFPLGAFPHKPKRHEFCLARYHRQWLRGECLNIFGNKFEIFLIDIGPKVLLSANSLRYYPDDLSITSKTLLIQFEGLPRSLNRSQNDFLSDYFGYNPQIKLTDIKPLQPPTYTAKCQKLVEEMVRHGLVQERT